MGTSGSENKQLRALALPIGGSIAAAVATMFVPTAVLETLTGATGLSELIPATGAPLGDKARALIAFGTGVLTLASLAVLQTKKDKSEMATSPIRRSVQEGQSAVQDEPAGVSLFSKLRSKLDDLGRNGISLPWSKKDDSDSNVYDLRDLPKLRTADAHPDAPSRRPLMAGTDIPADDIPVAAPPAHTNPAIWGDEIADEMNGFTNLSPIGAGSPVAPSAEIAPENSEPVSEAEFVSEFTPFEAPADPRSEARVEQAPVSDWHSPAVEEAPTGLPFEAAPVAVETPAPFTYTVPKPEAVQAQPAPVAHETAPAIYAESTGHDSITDLLRKLEDSVQTRLSLLNRLQETAENIQSAPVASQPVDMAKTSDAPKPLELQPLAAVPSNDVVVSEPVEMDDALKAALATLQRMNAQAR